MMFWLILGIVVTGLALGISVVTRWASHYELVAPSIVTVTKPSVMFQVADGVSVSDDSPAETGLLGNALRRRISWTDAKAVKFPFLFWYEKRLGDFLVDKWRGIGGKIVKRHCVRHLKVISDYLCWTSSIIGQYAPEHLHVGFTAFEQLQHDPRSLGIGDGLRCTESGIGAVFGGDGPFIGRSSCNNGSLHLLEVYFGLFPDHPPNQTVNKNSSSSDQKIDGEQRSVSRFGGWRYYVNLVGPFWRWCFFVVFVGCGLWCAWYASILTLQWWQLALSIVFGCLLSTAACAIVYDWIFKCYGR